MAHRNPLSWYEVLSPKYDYIEPVLDYGQGPIETTLDYLVVEAYTKREAKIRAVRHWLKDTKTWAWMSAHVRENPWKGVTAERAQFPPPDGPIDWVLPYEWEGD